MKLKEAIDFIIGADPVQDFPVMASDDVEMLIRDIYKDHEEELEALQSRSCEGCKYQTIAEADCKTCSRYYRDEYEPKEQ